MPDNLQKALIDSLLACLTFLEHSDSDAVDPDSAMRALEDVAPLQNLFDAVSRSLVATFQQVAAEETDTGWREFIRLHPRGLGLVSPNAE
ncbi:hypothetical protein GA0070624_2133 [Micromonospora rhizosphaerae]|uniref:Uncharacterized protein n=1 Tax=Micromonospora rhizosphaerae TaxID=568872 RepID=A0A1C6RUF3_9ACTN|nr:hypothetical protein [Micromonospora rhizosphaerae]SCL20836.1 hypothetical protein GA0070624_2133 [Micromonospora rhizosphaerae]